MGRVNEMTSEMNWTCDFQISYLEVMTEWKKADVTFKGQKIKPNQTESQAGSLKNIYI